MDAPSSHIFQRFCFRKGSQGFANHDNLHTDVFLFLSGSKEGGSLGAKVGVLCSCTSTMAMGDDEWVAIGFLIFDKDGS